VHRYGVREVQKLLGLPRSTLRTLVEAGFVEPARGPRNAWRFSFQDLIILRTAQALAAARVPPQRITRAVKALRRRLPAAMPLSGLSICAVGDRVAVREGANRWQAESGQYLLAFEGDPVNGSLSVIERVAVKPAAGAREWLERALALEESDVDAALHAYEQAIATDPALSDAHINLGLLLHEAGRLPDAERVYRHGIERCASEPMLWYNLGVLLEDMDRRADAVKAYQAALQADPRMADCHYNLALLCEALKKPRDAIRHMAQYRRLVGKRGS
jgi:tetratricopeptide (TPR) repeat protein